MNVRPKDEWWRAFYIPFKSDNVTFMLTSHIKYTYDFLIGEEGSKVWTECITNNVTMRDYLKMHHYPYIYSAVKKYLSPPDFLIKKV